MKKLERRPYKQQGEISDTREGLPFRATRSLVRVIIFDVAVPSGLVRQCPDQYRTTALVIRLGSRRSVHDGSGVGWRLESAAFAPPTRTSENSTASVIRVIT